MTQDLKPLGADAVHVSIDLQRLFAEKTEWHTAAIPSILPNVVRLAEHWPGHTIFTRFTTPETPEEAEGHWKAYYRRWESVTTGRIGHDMIDLVDELVDLVPPAHVIDKPTYSAFEVPAFCTLLDELGCRTVICTGVETDVCVLGTVMTAMDRGYRVVVVTDAVESSTPASHRATLDHVYRRFDEQIEFGTTDEVIAAWARP